MHHPDVYYVPTLLKYVESSKYCGTFGTYSGINNLLFCNRFEKPTNTGNQIQLITPNKLNLQGQIPIP